MEKKTLGTFLAALRKANGMTQKQLADMLNVSDKSVSRWERDECAPDLCLIPVIAEIFGITSDELLRGQRRSPDAPQLPQEDKKSEKQLRYLLNATLSRFHIHSLIAGAIAAVGFIAAMICNLGFLRAYLGFLAGLVFFVAAGVCETIFLILLRGSLRDAEIPDELLEGNNRAALKTAQLTYGIIAFFFAVCLPLIIFPGDPYYGLHGESWLFSGSLFGGISIAVSVITAWISQRWLAKNGKISITPSDEARMKLRRKTLRIAAILLSITLLAHWGFNQFTSATSFADGYVFHSLEEFKDFMETPMEPGGGEASLAWDGPADSPTANQIYVFDDGSIIDPAEIEEETLYGADEQPLCSYRWLNMSVAEIHYGDVENEMLPITVFTESDRIYGSNIRDNINTVFILLYFVGAAGIVSCYLIKSKKIQ